MSAVSETIVREYFELHGFFVRQHRKYVAPTRKEDEEIDFFVLNPQPRAGDAPLPFVITSGDLPLVARAIVAVKGWHTESFSPAVLANAPEIFRFVEPPAFQKATKAFGGDGPPTRIPVVPALPQNDAARNESIELLRSKGIDAVIPFHTMLADLIFVDVPGRVAKQLLQLAQKFGSVDSGQLRVTHDLTQEELAQLVGASRETVNKALADFASRGWLRLEGKSVVILDRDRLARRAR